jgi:hypothetical protein
VSILILAGSLALFARRAHEGEPSAAEARS